MNENSIIQELLVKAWEMRRVGNYDDARHLVKEAQRLCNDYDYNSLGRIFHIKMQFESDHRRLSKALEMCKKSLINYKKSNNLNKIAHSTRHLADLERHLGKEDNSENNYRVAIDIYKNNPNTSNGDLANALRGFGLLLEKRRKIKEAIAVWKETKDLYQACNLQAGVDEANNRLGLLA